MDNNVIISVKGLSKIYKLYDRPSDRIKEALGLSKKKHHEHYALCNVNFEVRKGETVGIIGANGSGKSTILKIITGVLGATAGEVIVDGRISALLELGAGFNMEYTGIENIYLNGTMIGFTREEIEVRMEEIVKFADIGEFINQPVKTYSSGMFVRLAFAVAINIDPEILIVDEALSVGDVFFQSKCYRKFEEFKKAGKTILFVSHDMGSIGKYCDRAILLSHGEKITEGRPKDVIDIYKKILVNQFEDNTINNQVNERKEEIVWKTQMRTNPKTIEYGNKQAEIIDFCIMNCENCITNNIEKGIRFTIKIKVLFHNSIQQPIFAFTIKDLKGTEITGTNTLFEKVTVKDYKKGDVVEITFTQDMTLQGAEYLVSFGCTGYIGTEFVVFHRLYDACSLTVISDKNTVGYYDMNSEVFLYND